MLYIEKQFIFICNDVKAALKPVHRLKIMYKYLHVILFIYENYLCDC